MNVNTLIPISGRKRARGIRGRGDREPETWQRRQDGALLEALHDRRIRRLARNLDGLSESSLTILVDFTDVLRAVEGLHTETAEV